MYIHILEDMKEQRNRVKEIIKKEIEAKKYDMKIGISEGDPYIFLEKLEKLKNNAGRYILLILI